MPFQPDAPPRKPYPDPGRPLTIAKGAARVVASFHYDGACLVTADARLSCWMGDETQRFAYGDMNAWARDFERVADLSATAAEACALRPDGTVLCRNPLERLAGSDGAVIEVDIADAIDIAVADGQACAVRHDHTVACWGDGVR